MTEVPSDEISNGWINPTGKRLGMIEGKGGCNVFRYRTKGGLYFRTNALNNSY